MELNWTWWTSMEHASLVRYLFYIWILLWVERLILINLALNISGDFNHTSQFNQTFFTEKLITEQSSDGSWHQLVDLNKK